jgi:transposase
MRLYAGIDLHSNNNFIGVIDEQDRRLFQKRLPNRLEEILRALEPFKESLEDIVIESTYNWYWIVDGLMEEGYKVSLANPSAIQQYEGLKHTDDRWDSFWLAHMKRLKILPEGYIYPKEERPVRDALRRRLMLVRQRTSLILSLQGGIARNLGTAISGNEAKKLTEIDVEQLFDSPFLALAARSQLSVINCLTMKINEIEKAVKAHVKLRPEFKILLTMPGIGEILGLTIMLEAGDISRFPEVGDYSSYCRTVKSEKISNKKKKGKGNQKNGNRYLAWAYIEAANHAIRNYPECERFYNQKKAERNKIVARKALSNKLARASYYVMRDQVPYDEKKLFRT